MHVYAHFSHLRIESAITYIHTLCRHHKTLPFQISNCPPSNQQLAPDPFLKIGFRPVFRSELLETPEGIQGGGRHQL